MAKGKLMAVKLMDGREDNGCEVDDKREVNRQREVDGRKEVDSQEEVKIY